MTKRIVIVGSGFAGMWAALSAARLIDQPAKFLAFFVKDTEAPFVILVE